MLDNLLNIGRFALGALGLGADRSADKYQREMHQQNLQQQKYQFEAQMNESIQRRVKDAKSAGIHPLFAMGASVGASPTANAGVPGQRGGQGFRNLAESLGLIQKSRSETKLNEAQAALADAQAAKLRQSLEATGSDHNVKTYPYGTKPGPGLEIIGPEEYVRPQIPYSSRPGVVAGKIPESIEILTKDGRTITVPNPDLNLDELTQPGTVEYLRNKAVYWLTDRMVDISRATRALRAPSNSEVARLERQLQAIKNNPEKVREAQALYRRWYKALKEYTQ